MREASSEKDLKRLLANVGIQLEAIKRGYFSFRDAQLELVKQYPQMVEEELLRYQDGIFKFFSIQTELKSPEGSREGQNEDQVDSMRFILKEVLNSDRGTKFYVKIRSPQLSENERKMNEDISSR